MIVHTNMVSRAIDVLNELNLGERECIDLETMDDGRVQMFVHYKTKTERGEDVENLLIEESEGLSIVVMHVDDHKIELQLWPPYQIHF
jgi:hypothetical protein